MQTSDGRVTARIVRTKDDENYTDRVGGVSYPTAEAIEAVLKAR